LVVDKHVVSFEWPAGIEPSVELFIEKAVLGELVVCIVLGGDLELSA
jgi:hypothetical protein